MGCGDIAINLFISGLLISSCIAIKEPKENPETQHCELSKFSLSNQSSAAAASASSPWPLSNSPSLLPTPLKFTLQTEKSFSMENDFSVCRVNFRGVGKSDGEFDNGQGELADAAAALDWLERENFDNSQCWVSGFSFGSLIAMQLLMRRPEINRFIAISPQPNVYDFSFLSPCPTSGMVVYGKKDELVPVEYITELDKRLSAQKGIKVEFQTITEANHFFSKTDDVLIKTLDKYIKKETALY